MTDLRSFQVIVPLLLLLLGSLSWAEKDPGDPARTDKSAEQEQTSRSLPSALEMKMTTAVPDGIAAPERIDTRFGTLEFTDGFPTEETAEKIYDQLDFQRAVQSVLLTTPGASLMAFRNGIREFGPDNSTGIMWQRMDSKVLLLTPNTTVIYVFVWVNTQDGPVVVDAPPNVLAFVDDFWFRYVTDIGAAGPDRGQGGKYLITPPGYAETPPPGYFVSNSPTYGNWLILRGSNLEEMQQLQVYPLSQADDPPPFNLVNVEMRAINTLHATDFSFFEEINQLVQEEPNSAMSPEILGMLASIGIEKGKPFNPDKRMKGILTEAAAVGGAASRVLLYRSRDPDAQVYPDSGWEHPWIGGSSTFDHEGVRLLDARTRFHYYATGITPAMVNPGVGKGSQYIAGLRDQQGKPLDGAKTYRVHLPPDVPANQFWAFTVYDVQTRSMLQTDQRYPEIASKSPDLEQNADGSYDVYFGPQAPEGKEGNWIQTLPGKGWHMLFRLYGPEQAWFDQTWRPSEIERLDRG